MPDVQTRAAAQTVQTTHEQSAPVVNPVMEPPGFAGKAPAIDGLSDLDAMTFSCAKASLNAAAGQAAKVPSLGTYQFSYFNYEVHFKSNYKGEADLKYCVTIYCQQGWDPKTTQISVRVMTNERQSTEVMAHGAECGNKQEPVKRGLRR